jgi:hypothetical protein
VIPTIPSISHIIGDYIILEELSISHVIENHVILEKEDPINHVIDHVILGTIDLIIRDYMPLGLPAVEYIALALLALDYVIGDHITNLFSRKEVNHVIDHVIDDFG